MSLIKIIKTEDGSHSLLNDSLNETYHSTHGAIQESIHVFIRNGLQFFANKKSEIKVFEVGFGTGLNAFLAIQFSIEHKIKVDYTSIETFPIHWSLASQLNYADLISFENGKTLFEKIHQCEWNKEIQINEFFSLTKLHQTIQSTILKDENFDVVFFDAFAPSKQPELWELSVLEKTIHSLKSNGVFVTYCAQGQLKRNLKQLGMKVESLPGPPGKREMVRAIKL